MDLRLQVAGSTSQVGSFFAPSMKGTTSFPRQTGARLPTLPMSFRAPLPASSNYLCLPSLALFILLATIIVNPQTDYQHHSVTTSNASWEGPPQQLGYYCLALAPPDRRVSCENIISSFSRTLLTVPQS